MLSSGRVVTVRSVKGGCGATTVSCVLAAVAAQLGRTVLCVDMCPGLGSTAVVLNVEPSRGIFSLVENEELELSDFTLVEQNLYFCSSSAGWPADLRSLETAVTKLISEFRRLFELIVLDLPSVLYGDLVWLALKLMSLADSNLLVSDFSMSAAVAAKRFEAMLITCDNLLRTTSLVLNMRGETGGFRAVELPGLLAFPISAVLSRDERVMGRLDVVFGASVLRKSKNFRVCEELVKQILGE